MAFSYDKLWKLLIDKNKFTDKGCTGAPEYWIVDPNRRTVTVNYFEDDSITVQYPFGAAIKVNIYDDLFIDFKAIEQLLNS